MQRAGAMMLTTRLTERQRASLDPVKRAALFIKMNDTVVEDVAIIPVVNRRWVSAMSHKLRATLSAWDNDFWNLKDWYRET
jgi:peptide/nickel transport system substrate-binding protein